MEIRNGALHVEKGWGAMPHNALHDVFNIFFFSLYSHYVGNPHEPAKETINPCRTVDNFR